MTNATNVFYWLVCAIILIGTGFYIVNTYVYDQKQGDAVTPLSNGTHLGFIHAFTDNNTAIDFDDAELLTGKDAEEAAMAAGQCSAATRQDCAPGGYFIANPSPIDVRVVVDPQVEVYTQVWQPDETNPDTGAFAPSLFATSDFAIFINDPGLQWQHTPYTITVHNGVVTRIEEVYVP